MENENGPLTAVSLVLAPWTIHYPVAVVVRRHAPSFAAVPGRLGDRILLHDLGAEGRGGGGGGGALAASNLVAAIRTIQVTVATPVDRNASGPIALEPVGAYWATKKRVTVSLFSATYHLHFFLSFFSFFSFFPLVCSSRFYVLRSTKRGCLFRVNRSLNYRVATKLGIRRSRNFKTFLQV